MQFHFQQDVVCDEAKKIIDKFTGEEATKKYAIKDPQRLQKCYDKLCVLAAKFRQTGKDAGDEPLNMLKAFLLDNTTGSPTSFQFNQSGIVPAIVNYLTDQSDQIHPSRNLLFFFAYVSCTGLIVQVHVDCVALQKCFLALRFL